MVVLGCWCSIINQYVEYGSVEKDYCPVHGIYYSYGNSHGDLNIDFTHYYCPGHLKPNKYTIQYIGNNSTGGNTNSSIHEYDTPKKLNKNEFERKYTVTYNPVSYTHLTRIQI